jgi:hypothetical protein
MRNILVCTKNYEYECRLLLNKYESDIRTAPTQSVLCHVLRSALPLLCVVLGLAGFEAWNGNKLCLWQKNLPAPPEKSLGVCSGDHGGQGAVEFVDGPHKFVVHFLAHKHPLVSNYLTNGLREFPSNYDEEEPSGI